jgi:hypothetical protein
MSKDKKTDQENKVRTSIPIDKSIADSLSIIADTLHATVFDRSNVFSDPSFKVEVGYENSFENLIRESFVSGNFLDFERNMVDGLYAIAGSIGEVAKAMNKRTELEESKEDIFK